MSDLIDFVIGKHGGLERWGRATSVTAEVHVYGGFWAFKGQPDLLGRVLATADVHRQRISIAPFGEGRTLEFDQAADRLVNLGFSGSMMLDPFVARTIRDLPANMLSVEVGINIVGGDVMRRRVFAPAVHGFLDTVRDGHPTAPLLVVGPLLCPIYEDTPGPGVPDFADGTVRFRAVGDPAEINDGPVGKLSLRAVRAELARIVAERSPDDPHLHLLDGLALYGEADAADHPLPDRLHPDAVTHRIVGERFAAHTFGPAGPFATAPG